MLDFNGANEQTEGGGSGPIIPHKSAVKLRITGIKQPSAQQQSNVAPAFILSVNGSGVESHGLVLLFEVVAGQFAGNDLSKWYTIQGGSDKAREFAFDAMRAVIDSARGLDFADNSDNAEAARQIDGYGGFVGMEFPAEIKVKEVKPGDKYINNEIGNIIKITDNRYQHIMAGGDVITETPIPQIPQGNQGGQAGGNNYTPPGNNYAAPNQGGQAPNQAGNTYAPPDNNQGQGNPNGGYQQNAPAGNQAPNQGNPNGGYQGQPSQGGGYQAPNQGQGGGGPTWSNPNQGGQQPPNDDIPF